MFDFFKRKIAAEEFGRQLLLCIEFSKGLDWLDDKEIELSEEDKKRFFREIMIFRVFCMDFAVWSLIRDEQIRVRILDTLYGGIASTHGLAKGFRSDKIVLERFGEYAKIVRENQGKGLGEKLVKFSVTLDPYSRLFLMTEAVTTMKFTYKLVEKIMSRLKPI
jgi:hypothetical protein